MITFDRIHLVKETKLLLDMKVAVVGATGLVGNKMLQILQERKFPVSLLIPVASERSAGKRVRFRDEEWTVITPENALLLQPDLALFSAGGKASLEWAPRFAEIGCTVIDNSSAWRMDPDKKLIVPEVNGQVLEASDKIIANPNCSTIQMVVALQPLHQKWSPHDQQEHLAPAGQSEPPVAAQSSPGREEVLPPSASLTSISRSRFGRVTQPVRLVQSEGRHAKATAANRSQN